MSNEVEFNSLTKDDVKITFEDSSHTSKPSEDEITQHRKTRLALVVVFAVIVIVMVVVAVIIIIVAPKCEKKEEVPEEKKRSGDEWLKHGIIYQVYPRSFKDSGEDGNGDLKGILEKMDYFTELGVQAVWLSPIYDMKNFTTIDPMFGTIEDFDKFIKEAHEKGIKVVMGFVPNHSSNKHPWFVESQKAVENAYRDYYIWQGGPAKNQTPNNWMSVFGGSAWTYQDTRKQFYFHQFSKEKPDLNLRNEKVKKELQDVLKFWLAKGVDGFNFDAVQFLIENDNYANETAKSNYNALNPKYDMLNHTLTYDLDESRTLVKEFQDFLNKQSGSHPILFTEVNGPYDKTSKYYEVSDIPFNFGLITKLNEQGMTLAQSINKTVIEYLASVPKSKTPNWVTGDDDHERIGSRVGEDNRHAMNVLALTLPGLVSTYYGVEIGMLNGKIANQTDRMDIARGLDLLVNISGPAELMKQIQQPHGEVKKRSSEVQASREEFGDVSETEKLVGQRGIQPESELTKSTSNESEEAKKLVGQREIQSESELTKGTSKESEGLHLIENIPVLDEFMKQTQQLHGKVKKNPSEVQASREKFGNVSETEKLVGQQDIQPEREPTKRPTEIEEAKKLVGQPDIQSERELTEGASKESEEAEKLVGQQDVQPAESELTKGASKKSEEAQQERLQKIIEKTKGFEVSRKECFRVLPYTDESGQVYVHLYVLCGNKDIPEELKAAAEEYFREMGVELKWTDLYNEASDEPNISFGVSRRLEKSEVDKISKIINTSLPIFEKYRNITAVHPSLKITNSKQTDKPCIMISVVGKRRIPIGETYIPRIVGNYPVDIVEGFWIETGKTSTSLESQEEMEYLRLGASIGNKEVNNAGTLGAILKGENGKLYLLSCDHVIEGSEIIHPGRLHYLQSLTRYLTEYSELLEKITRQETSLSLEHKHVTELELLKLFRKLQTISDRYPYHQLPLTMRCSGTYKKFIECAQKLEELFKRPPRVVADRSFGFPGNVCILSSLDKPKMFIDAAVAQLKKEEVDALKRNNFLEIIGTADGPNGIVIKWDVDHSHPSEREWSMCGSQSGLSSMDYPFLLSPVYLRNTLGVRVKYLDIPKNIANEDNNRDSWQFCSLLDNKEGAFAGEGDSGAVVFEKRKGQRSMSGIGIVIGGYYVNEKLYGTLLSSLDIARRILSLGIENELQLVPGERE